MSELDKDVLESLRECRDVLNDVQKEVLLAGWPHVEAVIDRADAALAAYDATAAEDEEPESWPIRFPDYVKGIPAEIPTDLPSIEKAYGLPAGFLEGCEDMPTAEVVRRIRAGIVSILESPA